MKNFAKKNSNKKVESEKKNRALDKEHNIRVSKCLKSLAF